jgi:hypothetical protein
MAPDTSLSFDQLLAEQVRVVANAIAGSPAPTEAQRLANQQSVANTFKALQPRDAFELILAGHCVMYDRLLWDAVDDMRHAPTQQARLRASPGVRATGKMFLNTVNTLLRRQGRLTARVTAPLKEAVPAEPIPAANLEQPKAPVPTARPDVVSQPTDVARSPNPANVPGSGSIFGPDPAATPRGDPRPATRSTYDRLLSSVSHAAMPLPAQPPGIGTGQTSRIPVPS